MECATVVDYQTALYCTADQLLFQQLGKHTIFVLLPMGKDFTRGDFSE